MRRGLRGGVFVSRIPMQSVLKGVAGTLDFNGATGECSWAISTQLEPLVIAEATRNADVDSLAELNAAVEGMALAIADPLELPRRYWFFCRRLAELGSNPLLTAIYLSLLDVLEKRNGLLQQVPPETTRRQVPPGGGRNRFREYVPHAEIVRGSRTAVQCHQLLFPMAASHREMQTTGSEDHDRKWTRAAASSTLPRTSNIPRSRNHHHPAGRPD